MPMLTPAHIGKERYARTCVPGTPQGHHRHGRAKWYEGTNKGEQTTDKGEKNARRRTRATEVKHNTKKKKNKQTHKQKLNIHTWLVGSKYVACHVTLRNKQETRTATTPTKVKGDHEA